MMIATILDARVVSEQAYSRDAGGNRVTKIRVADNPSRKNDRNPCRFLNVEGWGVLGDQLAKLSKGDMVAVSGELKIDKYTDKQGTERTDDVLVCTNFRVLRSESFFGKAPEAPAGNTESDSDIPF